MSKDWRDFIYGGVADYNFDGKVSDYELSVYWDEEERREREENRISDDCYDSNYDDCDYSYGSSSSTSAKNRGWRYNCEDGSVYNLFPKDFKTKKEYENALSQAKEKALLAEKKELRRLGVLMGKLVWLNILSAIMCFIAGCLSLSSEDGYSSAYIMFACAILNMIFAPLSLKKSRELLSEKSSMSTIRASEWLTFQFAAAVSCLLSSVILLIVLCSL